MPRDQIDDMKIVLNEKDISAFLHESRYPCIDDNGNIFYVAQIIWDNRSINSFNTALSEYYTEKENGYESFTNALLSLDSACINFIGIRTHGLLSNIELVLKVKIWSEQLISEYQNMQDRYKTEIININFADFHTVYAVQGFMLSRIQELQEINRLCTECVAITNQKSALEKILFSMGKNPELLVIGGIVFGIVVAGAVLFFTAPILIEVVGAACLEVVTFAAIGASLGYGISILATRWEEYTYNRRIYNTKGNNLKRKAFGAEAEPTVNIEQNAYAAAREIGMFGEKTQEQMNIQQEDATIQHANLPTFFNTREQSAAGNNAPKPTEGRGCLVM